MNECTGRRVKRAAVTIAILATLWGLLQLLFWILHPRFFNEYVVHDGLPFYHWWPSIVAVGAEGNAAVVDYQHNVLVVFLIAHRGIETGPLWLPHGQGQSVAFQSFCNRQQVTFVVPNTSNTLFILGAHGTRLGFSITSEEARHIYRNLACSRGEKELVPILIREYSKRHSGTELMLLEETINRIQRE